MAAIRISSPHVDGQIAVMVRLTRPLRGFAVAGALLLGCLPGVAQAKWMKATVSGATVLTTTSPTASDGLGAGASITALTFIIQNYAGSTGGATNFWNQTTVKPNYTQLFGFGTGVGSTGLQGNYSAHTLPYDNIGVGNFISSDTVGTNFNLRVGTQGSSSGLNVVIGGVNKNVEYILLENGNLNLNNTPPTSNDVVDFLKASLGSPQPRTCTGNFITTCVGRIQTSTEGAITFSWTNIQFDEIEAVPAPLPIAGALAGFRFSRKIRSRIKAN